MLAFGAVALLIAIASAAGSNASAVGSSASEQATYEVTVQVSSSWQASEPSGIVFDGRATASAQVVATGTPGPNDTPPTTFTGQAT